MGPRLKLHLENGQVIAPGGYAPHLSRGSHAVFMVRDANGLHTMAAVRWASISHMAVRGLRQLPEGVFDDALRNGCRVLGAMPHACVGHDTLNLSP